MCWYFVLYGVFMKYFLGIVLLLVVGCTTETEIPYVERPVEDIYLEAYFYLEQGEFSIAAPLFEEVSRQHAYSVWARQAQIMAGYAYYREFMYDEAVTVLEQFIQLHPADPSIPYAYYLKALCYYEQISDVYRDQGNTRRAQREFTEVIRRFPQSDYAKDARMKLHLTRDHLAGQEMAIGRYYLRRYVYQAAINRFQEIVRKYETTAYVPEALYRLTEAYLSLGLTREAIQSTAILGYNYPDSIWYQDGYTLLSSYGLIE